MSRGLPSQTWKGLPEPTLKRWEIHSCWFAKLLNSEVYAGLCFETTEKSKKIAEQTKNIPFLFFFAPVMLHCKVLKVVKWTFQTSQVWKPLKTPRHGLSQPAAMMQKEGGRTRTSVFLTDGVVWCIEWFLKSFDLPWFHRKGCLVGELLVQRRKNMKKRKFKDANLVRYYINLYNAFAAELQVNELEEYSTARITASQE